VAGTDSAEEAMGGGTAGGLVWQLVSSAASGLMEAWGSGSAGGTEERSSTAAAAAAAAAAGAAAQPTTQPAAVLALHKTRTMPPPTSLTRAPAYPVATGTAAVADSETVTSQEQLMLRRRQRQRRQQQARDASAATQLLKVALPRAQRRDVVSGKAVRLDFPAFAAAVDRTMAADTQNGSRPGDLVCRKLLQHTSSAAHTDQEQEVMVQLVS
jgi:hypothetical protein